MILTLLSYVNYLYLQSENSIVIISALVMHMKVP